MQLVNCFARFRGRGKKMKVVLRTILKVLVAGLFSHTIIAPASAEDFTMLLAHHYPEAQAAGIRLFVDEVEKNSNGRIRVQVYGAETFISGLELLDAVAGGVVDVATMPSNYQTGSIPELKYFTYPFMFDDAHHFRRAVEGGIKEIISPEYASRGILLLNYYHKGALHLMHKSMFLTSEQNFDGVRIRSLGPAISMFLASVSANPLSVPLGEVDAALQRNVIDAVTTNCAAHISRGWVEHLKFVTFGDISQSGEGLGINPEFFNSLPADLQEILTDAAKLMEDFQWSSMIEEDEVLCERRWQDAGAEVHHLTQAERAFLVEHARPILEQAIQDNPGIAPFADIANRTR